MNANIGLTSFPVCALVCRSCPGDLAVSRFKLSDAAFQCNVASSSEAPQFPDYTMHVLSSCRTFPAAPLQFPNSHHPSFSCASPQKLVSRSGRTVEGIPKNLTKYDIHQKTSPGAKTINVSRACLGAQLTICAQK